MTVNPCPRVRAVVTGALAHPARTGLVAAILVLVGGSLHQSMVVPPYRFIDEQAHVGYVLSVQDGTLPTIDADEGGQASASVWPRNLRDAGTCGRPTTYR